MRVREPIAIVVEILKRAEISVRGFVEPEQMFFSAETHMNAAKDNLEDNGE